jgi:hypothetical protein
MSIDDKSKKPGDDAKDGDKFADRVSKDDPHKTEKLAKAGRDLDTDTGQE